MKNILFLLFLPVVLFSQTTMIPLTDATFGEVVPTQVEVIDIVQTDGKMVIRTGIKSRGAVQKRTDKIGLKSGGADMVNIEGMSTVTIDEQGQVVDSKIEWIKPDGAPAAYNILNESASKNIDAKIIGNESTKLNAYELSDIIDEVDRPAEIKSDRDNSELRPEKFYINRLTYKKGIPQTLQVTEYTANDKKMFDYSNDVNEHSVDFTSAVKQADASTDLSRGEMTFASTGVTLLTSGLKVKGKKGNAKVEKVLMTFDKEGNTVDKRIINDGKEWGITNPVPIQERKIGFGTTMDQEIVAHIQGPKFSMKAQAGDGRRKFTFIDAQGKIYGPYDYEFKSYATKEMHSMHRNGMVTMLFLNTYKEKSGVSILTFNLETGLVDKQEVYIGDDRADELVPTVGGVEGSKTMTELYQFDHENGDVTYFLRLDRPANTTAQPNLPELHLDYLVYSIKSDGTIKGFQNIKMNPEWYSGETELTMFSNDDNKMTFGIKEKTNEGGFQIVSIDKNDFSKSVSNLGKKALVKNGLLYHPESNSVYVVYMEEGIMKSGLMKM